MSMWCSCGRHCPFQGTALATASSHRIRIQGFRKIGFLLVAWLLIAGAIGWEGSPGSSEELPKRANAPSPSPTTNLPNRSLPEAPGEAWPDRGQLVLLDGPAIEAALEFASQGKMRFRTSEGKTVSTTVEELLRWGSPREVQRAPVLVLNDGGLLVAQVSKMADGLLEVEADLLEPKGPAPTRMPVGQVLGVVFRLPSPLAERDQLLDRLHRQRPEEDRLLLLNGDELQGRLEAIEAGSVRWAGPLGSISVEIPRIRAIQFRRLPLPASRPEGLRIWVGLQDGSLLLAERLNVHQAKADLTLPSLLSFQTHLENLVFLQPIGARVVYLSDLEPKHYQFEPFFELVWPWQPDRSVTGTWLRCGGRRYLKGLGVHSKASLTYDLQGRYSRLEAELALDDTSAGRGSVIYRVLADGKPIYETKPISSGDPPLAIRLDITNVQQLTLLVDYGAWGDQLDRANWLDARLIPNGP